jgi:hypothetical protein
VYQQIMYDVHRQWLAEFDQKAALKRQLPRRRRSGGRWPRLRLAFRALRPAAQRPPAAARPCAQAPQCT